jgi:hypothetical protein
VADAQAAEIREEIKAWLGVDDLAPEVFLGPSGTDLELVALALVAAIRGQPLVNIMVGPLEIGSGSTLAAGGRHYSRELASGQTAAPGEPVNARLADEVAVAEVRLRAPDGTARPTAVIDDAVWSLLDNARRHGRGAILHVVAHSKTGVHAPSLATVARLMENDQGAVVLIDAAQGRFSRRGAREMLRRGCWLLVTGSKFFGGPAFSGALLIPGRSLAPWAAELSFPSGLADYISAAEVPPAFGQLRESLGPRTNFGLILRWRAALAEIAAYYQSDAEARLKVLRHFEAEAPRVLSASSHISLLDDATPLVPDEAERLLESKRTVFNLAVTSARGRRLGRPGLASLVRALNRDVNAEWPSSLSPQESDCCSRCFHIGQPVIIGEGEQPEPLAVVRVALGGSMITDLATGATPAATLEEGLQWLSDQLSVLRDKIDLLARHAEELGWL